MKLFSALLVSVWFAFVLAAHATSYEKQDVQATSTFGYGKEGIIYFSNPLFQITNTSTETDSFLFVNVSTNTTRALLLNLIADSTIGKAANATYKLYSAPVVSSSGTAANIVNANTGFTGVSQMQVYSGPTITSRGSLLGSFSVGANSNAMVFNVNSGITISTGTKVLITDFVSAASTASISFMWMERAP